VIDAVAPELAREVRVTRDPSDLPKARYCTFFISPCFAMKLRNKSDSQCVREFNRVENSRRIIIFLPGVSEDDRRYIAGCVLYNMLNPANMSQTVMKVIHTVFEEKP
jgi:hypothetical protein